MTAAAFAATAALTFFLFVGMTTGMNVPVSKFFGFSFANRDDVHFEVERFTSKGMIAVQLHRVFRDFHHGEHAHATRSLGAETHAGSDVFDGQMLARHVYEEVILGKTVAFFRRDGNLDGVAFCFASKGFLQPGNQVAVAVEVFEGLTSFAGIDDVAAIVGELVMNLGDFVFFDGRHDGSWDQG